MIEHGDSRVPGHLQVYALGFAGAYRAYYTAYPSVGCVYDLIPLQRVASGRRREKKSKEVVACIILPLTFTCRSTPNLCRDGKGSSAWDFIPTDALASNL